MRGFRFRSKRHPPKAPRRTREKTSGTQGRLGPVTLTITNDGLLLHVLFTASNLCFLVLYFSKEKKEKSLTLLPTYISP